MAGVNRYSCDRRDISVFWQMHFFMDLRFDRSFRSIGQCIAMNRDNARACVALAASLKQQFDEKKVNRLIYVISLFRTFGIKDAEAHSFGWRAFHFVARIKSSVEKFISRRHIRRPRSSPFMQFSWMFWWTNWLPRACCVELSHTHSPSDGNETRFFTNVTISRNGKRLQSSENAHRTNVSVRPRCVIQYTAICETADYGDASSRRIHTKSNTIPIKNGKCSGDLFSISAFNALWSIVVWALERCSLSLPPSHRT